MATETVKFKVKLHATMWDQPPIADVGIDNKTYFKNNITGTEEEPNVIEFEHECEEGKSYELVIKRSNKQKRQTIVDSQGNILKDQLLNIKSIEIDDIDLGGVTNQGIYTPNYPEPWATQQAESGHELRESFTNVVQMGFNGTWRLKFSSPFYMWLLENLY